MWMFEAWLNGVVPLLVIVAVLLVIVALVVLYETLPERTQGTIAFIAFALVIFVGLPLWVGYSSRGL